jgi:hypothetical protein
VVLRRARGCVSSTAEQPEKAPINIQFMVEQSEKATISLLTSNEIGDVQFIMVVISEGYSSVVSRTRGKRENRTLFSPHHRKQEFICMNNRNGFCDLTGYSSNNEMRSILSKRMRASSTVSTPRSRRRYPSQWERGHGVSSWKSAGLCQEKLEVMRGRLPFAT